ncbi:unnamed protein product [Prunus brigantina]
MASASATQPDDEMDPFANEDMLDNFHPELYESSNCFVTSCLYLTQQQPRGFKKRTSPQLPIIEKIITSRNKLCTFECLMFLYSKCCFCEAFVKHYCPSAFM